MMIEVAADPHRWAPIRFHCLGADLCKQVFGVIMVQPPLPQMSGRCLVLAQQQDVRDAVAATAHDQVHCRLQRMLVHIDVHQIPEQPTQVSVHCCPLSGRPPSSSLPRPPHRLRLGGGVIAAGCRGGPERMLMRGGGCTAERRLTGNRRRLAMNRGPGGCPFGAVQVSVDADASPGRSQITSNALIRAFVCGVVQCRSA